MTKKNSFRAASEGDIEQVLKQFITMSKSKTKKKTINICVPTEKFSTILLQNINKAFATHDLGDPQNYHVHIFIEKGNNE